MSGRDISKTPNVYQDSYGNIWQAVTPDFYVKVFSNPRCSISIRHERFGKSFKVYWKQDCSDSFSEFEPAARRAWEYHDQAVRSAKELLAKYPY